MKGSVPRKLSKPPCPTALVLTGGGARGAYEVGVLQCLYETLVDKGPCERLFDILAGTSAGALNACALGSMVMTQPFSNSGSIWSPSTIRT